MKIMLVDDSSTMRRIQRTQFEQIGYTDIIEAGDGEEALATLRVNMPVHLILLDWNMPVMDGMTFLQRVRSDPGYKNVKIIMCTSESEKSKVVEAIKAGADNYIVKPFTPQILKEKVQPFLI